MYNREKPDIFVISSQAPLKSLSDSIGIRQGKSGQIVQRLTGCEMFVISDDEVSGDEASMLKKNINHNSWIIITGHGSKDGGFSEIVGETDQFVIDTQFLFDTTLPVEHKKYPVSRYVDLMIDHGNLKEGNHINLMLFVCHAAKEDKKSEKKSFAEQFGKELAAKGITSLIIANESVFKRLKDPSVSEIKIHNKNKENLSSINEPPFVFLTNKKGETVKYQAPGDVTLTQDGVLQDGVSITREKYNKSFINGDKFHINIDKMYARLDEAIRARWYDDYDVHKVTFYQFMSGKADIPKLLNENSHAKFTIGVSESKPGRYRLSYLKNGQVESGLFKFDRCDKMLKFLDINDLWYDPYENYRFLGLEDMQSSSDSESPPARRIGLFDTVNNKDRQGRQSDFGKDADSVKKSNNNNNNNNK